MSLEIKAKAISETHLYRLKSGTFFYSKVQHVQSQGDTRVRGTLRGALYE